MPPLKNTSNTPPIGNTNKDTSQIPTPVPETAASTPAGPEIPGQGEISQEQMRTNLQNMMSKIDSKYKDFSNIQVSSDAKLKEQQSEALRQVFDLIKSFGVDPTDKKQVKEFLAKIKAKNPELFKQIDAAMLSILGNEAAGPQTDILAPGEVAPATPTPIASAGPQNNNVPPPIPSMGTNMNINNAGISQKV